MHPHVISKPSPPPPRHRGHLQAGPMYHCGFLQPLRSWGHPRTTQGRKSTDWRYQEGNAPEQPLTNEGGTWWIISKSSSLMVTLGGSSILRVKLIFSPGSGSFPPLPPRTSRGPLPKKLLAPRSLSQHMLWGKPRRRSPPSRLFLTPHGFLPSLLPPSYFQPPWM